MTVFVVGLILVDGWLDGSLLEAVPNKPVQATLFTLLIALLAIPAQFELGNLIKNTGAHLFKSITTPASILLAAGCYVSSIGNFQSLLYYLYVLAFSFLALFIMQAVKFGTEGTIRNIGASFFAITYLGLLCSFILKIRILWGPVVLLFFIFTVKASDIGAYTIGRLFGKHKLCPRISPGKTWEGLGGAILFGAVVSIGISSSCGIMSVMSAAIFGAVFGILGQMGDLAESMLKRDAVVKDSSASVPGFGGLLDVIDSPLATAPAALLALTLLLKTAGT